MTTSGRTYWMAKDAGWWRREGIVALGEEFGAAGPAVLDWLSCEAKAQNDGGWVKSGFRSIARGCFVELVTVGHAVSRSVTLGLLDDYEERDGRFTCRISGWQADQERAHAAGRKAAQRARNAETPGDSPPVVTVSHGESRSVTECPPTGTGQDRTEEDKGTTSSELAKASPDTIRLSHLLADLILERDAKAKVTPESDRWLAAMRLLLADRDNDAGEVEQVLRWSQTDSFWQANILSPNKLRDKFTQLTVKMKAAPIRQAAETAAPTRWADRATEWAAEDAKAAAA